MLWLCAWLPRLGLDCTARLDEAGAAPAVLTASRGGRERVVLADERARAHGVHPGLSLSAALALCPGLAALPRNERAERATLERLASWAGRFTSRVCLVLPDAMLLEIGASLALFGGLEKLVGGVGQGLEGLGYHALLATAPTPLAAEWLARSGSCRHCPSREALPGAVADLPLDVLVPEGRDRDGLAGMGLRTVGDLLAQPRAGLGRRFGPWLVDALDRAVGVAPDPRPAFEPPARFRAEVELPSESADTTALLFPLRRLLDELSAVLQGRCLVVQSLHLELRQRGEGATNTSLGLRRATADGAYLLGLLRERLERVRPRAPVTGLILESGVLFSAARESGTLFGADGGAGGLETLLDRLRARLGEAAVEGIAPAADHRPERAWCRVAAGQAVTTGGSDGRPLWLLPEPRRLETRSGRPWLDGPLRLSGGGERLEAGWWDGAEVRREYYRALDCAGARLWIYRDLTVEDAQWYLHGLFA
ncbi:MAG TPA: DNA polymerase Y family protein [Gammaproteobacteria bacterium]|nr:DNA polymerase Y family protein [Gammaproteobacteria bacterium]